MGNGESQLGQRERLALVSLWTIPGVGPLGLASLQRVTGSLESLLEEPPRRWMSALPLSDLVRERLDRYDTLREIGERTLERAQAKRMRITYAGEPAYPPNLVGMPDAPPLLFHFGTPGERKPCAAMVGSRHPDQGFLPDATRFARDVARAGVCIVSGAAEGVDSACHQGALQAKAETWAFVGSALDQLDPWPAELLPAVLEGGGVFYSELPPGTRASKQSFPRRNRLISGASELVVMLRAAEGSGTRHTALAAIKQGRRLLALGGDGNEEASALCHRFIRAGAAEVCLGPGDVLRALGIEPGRPFRAPKKIEADLEALSEEARSAYGVVPRVPTEYDEVLAATQLPPATLTSALCELELVGLVLQLPGKRYERL